MKSWPSSRIRPNPCEIDQIWSNSGQARLDSSDFGRCPTKLGRWSNSAQGWPKLVRNRWSSTQIRPRYGQILAISTGVVQSSAGLDEFCGMRLRTVLDRQRVLLRLDGADQIWPKALLAGASYEMSEVVGRHCIGPWRFCPEAIAAPGWEIPAPFSQLARRSEPLADPRTL